MYVTMDGALYLSLVTIAVFLIWDNVRNYYVFSSKN